jgi:hypothetical protein
MSGPYWLTDGLGAVMIGISLYCVVRMTGAALRRGALEWDVECAHVLMGVSMLGMLIPALSPVPARVYELVFAVAAVWFAWRLVCQARQRCRAATRLGGHAPHLVHSVAMLVMLMAAGAAVHARGAGRGVANTMAATAAAGGLYPTLSFALALVLAALAIWDIDRLNYCCATGAPGGRGCGFARRLRLDAALADRAGACALGGHEPQAGGRLDVGGSFCGALLAPAAALCCRIVIGITMAYMMIVMR